MRDDTISRQDAITLLEEAESARLRGDIFLFYPVMLNGLKKLPSAQQDIIACGDCKHWICHDRKCGFWNHGVKPLDWCCHAERRTE